MKKKLAIILCVALTLAMVPTASVFGATKMSISPKAMTIAVGDIAQLNVSNAKGKLTWKTSDKTIATVTSKGVVQGKAKGTVTITVKDTKKKSATCTVEVKQYAEDASEPTNVFELIKDKILELIKATTYTKSEIDSKIGSLSGGGTTVVNNCDCGDTSWSDGTIVSQNKNQNAPFTRTLTYDDDEGLGVNVISLKCAVKSCSVKKYHYNDFRKDSEDNRFYLYRVHCKCDLAISDIEDAVGFDKVYVEGSITPLVKGSCQEDGWLGQVVIDDEGDYTVEFDVYTNTNLDEYLVWTNMYARKSRVK